MQKFLIIALQVLQFVFLFTAIKTIEQSKFKVTFECSEVNNILYDTIIHKLLTCLSTRSDLTVTDFRTKVGNVVDKNDKNYLTESIEAVSIKNAKKSEIFTIWN